MGGESHAKAMLLYGIVLPTETLLELWVSTQTHKIRCDPDEEDVRGVSDE